MPRRIGRARDGERPNARALNKLIEAANNQLAFRVAPPLQLHNGPAGPLIYLSQSPDQWLGYPDATIAARSGTTVSKGTVSIHEINSSTDLLADSTRNLANVYNPWSIAATTATLVLVRRQSSGVLVIVAIDCEA